MRNKTAIDQVSAYGYSMFGDDYNYAVNAVQKTLSELYVKKIIPDIDTKTRSEIAKHCAIAILKDLDTRKKKSKNEIKWERVV